MRKQFSELHYIRLLVLTSVSMYCYAMLSHNAVTQVICGNKCDLQSQREVSTQEGVAYANKIGWPFFETSAKLAININEAVQELIRRYIHVYSVLNIIHL